MNNNSHKPSPALRFMIAFALLLTGVGLYMASYYNLLPRKTYTADDFNIETIYSQMDYNDNGIDDYTDILLGARKDAENHPTYNGAYYDGGYPPDDIGVCNLRVFFDEYALSLTLDAGCIDEWQPGDIVIFAEDKHIGIVSDKRNSKGQTYIIHNGGQPNREEDYFKRDKATGHYRFDASKVPADVIVKWSD